MKRKFFISIFLLLFSCFTIYIFTHKSSKENLSNNLRLLESSTLSSDTLDLFITNNSHNIYDGILGNSQIRVLITRKDQELSLSYITRLDKENHFSGTLIDSSNIYFSNINNEILSISLDDSNAENHTLAGTAYINGNYLDISLSLDTFYPITANENNYYDSISLSSSEAEKFAAVIKSSITDKEKFIDLFQFPVLITTSDKRIFAKNKEELSNLYDKLIYPNSFQIQTMFTKYLFANYEGICVERGILWFSKDHSGSYKITTLNF